jgi:ribokinase
MSIIVVGSSNTDMIIKVPYLPRPGETILGGYFTKAAGGKGANQAVAAARAGGDVKFIAKLGKDIFGEEALKAFKNDGINVDFVSKDDKAPSGIAQILVAEDGENSIAVASGANARLSVDDIYNAEEIFLSSNILLTQLETPIETVEKAVELAYEKGMRIILNPAPAQKLSDDLLSRLTYLTPNETEAELLTGIKITDDKSAAAACRELSNKGVKNVILTLGSKGVFVHTSDLNFQVSGYQVAAVDTTAAGDVFNGTFAVGLTKFDNLREAINFSNAAAALSVTRLGAQPSIPKAEEIERFIKSAQNN